jgi:hypothetical protein
VRAFTCPDCSSLVPFDATRCLVSDSDLGYSRADRAMLMLQCDVMSHVMSDHVDWRSVSEDVIRSSVRGTVPVLACVVGDCGVRSPG